MGLGLHYEAETAPLFSSRSSSSSPCFFILATGLDVSPCHGHLLLALLPSTERETRRLGGDGKNAFDSVNIDSVFFACWFYDLYYVWSWLILIFDCSCWFEGIRRNKRDEGLLPRWRRRRRLGGDGGRTAGRGQACTTVTGIYDFFFFLFAATVLYCIASSCWSGYRTLFSFLFLSVILHLFFFFFEYDAVRWFCEWSGLEEYALKRPMMLTLRPSRLPWEFSGFWMDKAQIE